MKYEPIINIKMRNFKDSFGYSEISDSDLFERFINNLLLLMHQPDATSKNSSLLEMTSVGGQDDMGIDGIAIKVNGSFVTSTKEIDNIIQLNRNISVEILFIQSKYKNRIDSGEYSKFADGIYDFLSDNHFEPHNEKIERLLEIKDYIFSNEIMQCWQEAPIVRAYYVIFGEWHGDEHIDGKATALKEKIEKLNSYGDFIVKNLGTPNIIKIYEENNNCFNVVINVLGTLDFEEVSGITNSQVILCNAAEFTKLLCTDEGGIRKTLFADNVRDFQGSTSINQNMLETLRRDPSAFLLLNNGITIVCSKLIASNRKVTITNPQIVNGCQTSSVIFVAHQQGVPLDNAYVLIKIIATEQSTITNSIVRGTNSQNPVFPENFEITRDFHKQLEAFINSIQASIELPEDRIYYERRSKQYEAEPLVKRYRTFGLETLAHSVVSCFMQAPHDSVLHIVTLLGKYKDSIFVNEQSFYPYYVSALLCLNIERTFLKGQIDKKYDPFKFLLMSIIVEKINGAPVNINSRNIDTVCDKLVMEISEEKTLLSRLQEAIRFYESTKRLWLSKQGQNYKHGIKDNPTFTKFLLTHLRGGNIEKIDITSEQEPEKRGVVFSTKQDRAGRYYGFIKAFPDNAFFHSEDNPKIDFSRIIGKTVTYRLIINPVNGKTKATDVKVIEK